MGAKLPLKFITMKYQDYYIALGKLLYAISRVDGKTDGPEIKEMQQVVSHELLNLDHQHDAFDSDTAFATEFEFDILNEWDADPEEAYNSFEEYIETTPDLPSFLKVVAYRSAMKVAHSHYATNKSEQSMLNRLKNLLRTS